MPTDPAFPGCANTGLHTNFPCEASAALYAALGVRTQLKGLAVDLVACILHSCLDLALALAADAQVAADVVLVARGCKLQGPLQDAWDL